MTIESGPEQQSWMTLGDHAFNQKDYPNALNYYTHALQQDPNNVSILSKIGNTFFSMQQTTAAEHFYWEALTTSNAITVIYEYTLTPMQTTSLSNLQEILHNQYNVSITIEGLDYMINTISQETREQPLTPPLHHQHSKPFENLVTTLLQHTGIPFTSDLFDLTEQIQQTISEQSQRQHQMNLSKRMSWAQLEEFCYHFFQHQGYHVTKTKQSHDQGADLLLRNDNEFIAVQIKKRKKSVGTRSVQETYAGRGYYGAHRAILISTSGFTKPALQLAEKVQVECWDWERLLAELRSLQLPPPDQDQPFQG